MGNKVTRGLKATCFDCGESFVKAHGVQIRCMSCRHDMMELWQLSGAVVLSLLKKGKAPSLSKEYVSCIDCGDRAMVYDHRNYDYPALVDPVCASCNLCRGPGRRSVYVKRDGRKKVRHLFVLTNGPRHCGGKEFRRMRRK